MITDRNTLDDQLFSRFIEAKEYLQTQSVHISSRKKLKAELLNKKAHGIYFTTIEKLEEDTGKLSDRDNIYVICDEAHRTQNNIESGFVIDKKQKTIRNKKGFAAYLREAFPNATYIGFTGTPLLGQLKKQTTDIFGPYTDRYLLKQAQEDGTVLKIYYEGVATEIKLPKELKKQIDDLQENFKNNIKDENNEIQSKKLFELDKTLNSSLIMENELVIKTKAQHILKHYHQRENVLHGKAMIVSPSRKAAYLYFKTLIEIEPTLKDKIILILSKDNKDSAEIEKAMIPNNKMNEVEKDFKKDDSKYKIAIVCDKWLTGFDVPDLDCIYLDKILK
jgi:type I restriction enzyme R subunit